MKPSIILILGPTGVGKSSIALEVAESCNGEIVSADSIQVYKDVDIGSAKASVEDRDRIPHHLVNELELHESFDVAKFVEMADRAIADIVSRGKRPIVVGGTNLYIRGLLHGIFEAPPASAELRKKHKDFAEENGTRSLHLKLAALDEESAKRIHENDLIRISRALEVFELTGKSISEHHKNHAFSEEKYRSQKVVVFRSREELYSRIDSRVDQMIEEGIFDEYKALVTSTENKNLKALNSIGYRHIRMFEEGMEYDEVLRLFKRDTRRFAKNQLSWLRGEEAWWFNPVETKVKKLSEDIERFFHGEEVLPEWLGSPTMA